MAKIKKCVFYTRKFILLFIPLFFGFVSPVYAVNATFQWDTNSEPDLAGYRVFCREEGQSYDYTNPSWKGTDTTCTIFNLDETKTYYFVSRAFNTQGLESSDSKELYLEAATTPNDRPPTANQPPIAVIAEDYIEAISGTTITLDGSRSTDADDGIASYQWRQVDGPSVTLSDFNSKVATFTAPETDQYGSNFTFRLTLTDFGGLQSTIICLVYVTHINRTDPEITLEAEDMPTKTTGGSTSGGWNIWSNGYIADDADFPRGGTYTFEISAKGSFAGGAWPEMELRIDQTVVGTATVESSEWSVYTVEASVASGTHEIAVAFTNDYYKSPDDRNLYVDKINVTKAGSSPPSTCILDSQFQQAILAGNITYYTDRNYELTVIPSKYIGMDMIKTSNDDRNLTTASDYLTFEMPYDGIVYVAFDSRATRLPSWMSGFSNTGERIYTSLSSQPYLKVYRKTYNSGACVNLGANKAPGFSGSTVSNYIVFW
jgi:hypothetical protein